MNRVAAIDTSTWWCGVALAERKPGGAQVVAEAGLLVRESHSRHLLALLEKLLAEAGWARTGLDAYAATRGPGSFTGVRVGLGTVRGLALAADRPCHGIGTLDALAAANGPESIDRIPVMGAGRGELYAARFDGASFPPRLLAGPEVGRPGRLLCRAGGPAALFGPGAESHREVLLGTEDGSWMRKAPASVAAAAACCSLHFLESGRRRMPGCLPCISGRRTRF